MVTNTVKAMGDWVTVVTKENMSSVVVCRMENCVYAFRIDRKGLDNPELVHAARYQIGYTCRHAYSELLHLLISCDSDSRYFNTLDTPKALIDTDIHEKIMQAIIGDMKDVIKIYGDRLLEGIHNGA